MHFNVGETIKSCFNIHFNIHFYKICLHQGSIYIARPFDLIYNNRHYKYHLKKSYEILISVL